MNAQRRESRAVVFSQRAYRRLLAAYPRAHREEYGGAMAQLFHDQCRDAWSSRRGWGLAWLWLRVLPDLVKTAVWERLTNRRERKYMFRKMIAGFRAHPAPWLGMFISVFVMVFILVVLVTTVVTFIQPEIYASKARIKVERDLSEMAANNGLPGRTGVYDPDFIRTEIEVIQSEKIFDNVIERLDLNTVWATKYNFSTKLKSSESRALLKRMTEVHPARNTSLIDITVCSDDRMEAAKIANTTAEVFADYRRNQRETLLAANEDEYKKLVTELKKELVTKTDDQKAEDDKITKMIERAAQLCMDSKGAISCLSVEIMEHAEPAYRPIRPNKPLDITLGVIIGAILGLLVAGLVVTLGLVMRKPAATEPAQSPPLKG